jgi:hypothetical protein
MFPIRVLVVMEFVVFKMKTAPTAHVTAAFVSAQVSVKAVMLLVLRSNMKFLVEPPVAPGLNNLTNLLI